MVPPRLNRINYITIRNLKYVIKNDAFAFIATNLEVNQHLQSLKLEWTVSQSYEEDSNQMWVSFMSDDDYYKIDADCSENEEMVLDALTPHQLKL